MATTTEAFSRANGKMSMPPDQKSPDTEKTELGEIRREVIESRNLVIKTDNLLKNLHAELKMVGKRQEDFQKRQWISSAVAYLVFAGLCVAGAVMVSTAQTSNASAEKERLQAQVAQLTDEVKRGKDAATAAQTASTNAGEVFRLMTTLQGDDRLKGVDALGKLDQSLLSELERKALADRAELLRKEIGQNAFERGKSAFRRNDMKTTVEELTRFMNMNPTPDDAVEASFFLGTAHNQLRQHEQAATNLQRFVTGDRRSKNRDYAMLLLAGSLEQSGQLDKAAEVAREALGQYPASEFAPALKSRLASVKRTLSGGAADPTAPAAPVAAQPAAPAPAQPAAPAAPAPKVQPKLSAPVTAPAPTR